MSAVKVLAIDLYGTVLDTSSITAVLKQYVPVDKAPKIAQDWRKYQLEYTWRLNSMDRYEPLDTVTRLSLIHTLKENSFNALAESTNDIDAILMTYSCLKPFSDAAAFISALPSLKHTRALIFSNGAPSIIDTTFSKSSLKSLRGMKYVSVDAVKRYKPCPKTYEHFIQTQRVDIDGLGPSEVYLVSSNPFDIVGAQRAGMGTIWVDREEKGWCDGLGEPAHIVKSLEEIVEIVERMRL